MAALDTFKAATWNVFHGTDLEDVEGTVRKILASGVSVILLQEATQDGLAESLEALGLGVISSGELTVAYHPAVWTGISGGGVRLSEEGFFRPGSDREVFPSGAWAILSDAAGRTVTALSYHLPSHVQVAHAPARRLSALRASMKTLGTLAGAVHTNAVLFGGDDNVDESAAFRFMRRVATGLRQIQAPKGTHGKRRIDDFRVKGLRAGSGHVLETASDHKAHIRSFTWA